MNQKTLYTISIIVLTLLISGCGKRSGDNYLIGKLESFENTDMVIPDQLEVVQDGSLSSYSLNPSINNHFVIYYDSLSCSSCQIKRLSENDYLFNLSDSLKSFDVLVIFSPKEDHVIDVIQSLLGTGCSYPVLIDTQHEFALSNPHIPSDNRFHYFLLNKESKPIFVGNPYDNDRLYNSFIKSLNNNYL